MPSVRDILFGAAQPAPAAKAGVEVVVPPGGGGGARPEGPKEDEKAALLRKQTESQSDMADRIRQAAQVRVQLARLEVERRQDQVIHLEQREAEMAQQSIPSAEITADLNEAAMRLNEARADLVRAEEAQLNTELTASQKIKAAQPAIADDKKPSVRDQLKVFFKRGEKGETPKLDVSGPKSSL